MSTSFDARLVILEARLLALENALTARSKLGSRVLESSSDINSGDTAWMLFSTVLVLFMTVPGLALYYSGLVRINNVLTSVMQTFSIAALITFLWLFYGYSIAFAPIHTTSNNEVYSIIGNGSRLWLNGMYEYSIHDIAPTIPESVFCTYQLTFAIITPALICGAFADRMKYSSMLIFMTLWHTIVYCPVAHMFWHPQGFLKQFGTLDFAGGNVVHLSSGVSGLICALVIGNRSGYGKERFQPHNILITVMGASMLWVGWFGFNAGSANSGMYYDNCSCIFNLNFGYK